MLNLLYAMLMTDLFYAFCHLLVIHFLMLAQSHMVWTLRDKNNWKMKNIEIPQSFHQLLAQSRQTIFLLFYVIPANSIFCRSLMFNFYQVMHHAMIANIKHVYISNKYVDLDLYTSWKHKRRHQSNVTERINSKSWHWTILVQPSIVLHISHRHFKDNGDSTFIIVIIPARYVTAL